MTCMSEAFTIHGMNSDGRRWAPFSFNFPPTQPYVVEVEIGASQNEFEIKVLERVTLRS